MTASNSMRDAAVVEYNIRTIIGTVPEHLLRSVLGNEFIIKYLALLNMLPVETRDLLDFCQDTEKVNSLGKVKFRNVIFGKDCNEHEVEEAMLYLRRLPSFLNCVQNELGRVENYSIDIFQLSHDDYLDFLDFDVMTGHRHHIEYNEDEAYESEQRNFPVPPSGEYVNKPYGCESLHKMLAASYSTEQMPACYSDTFVSIERYNELITEASSEELLIDADDLLSIDDAPSTKLINTDVDKVDVPPTPLITTDMNEGTTHSRELINTDVDKMTLRELELVLQDITSTEETPIENTTTSNAPSTVLVSSHAHRSLHLNHTPYTVCGPFIYHPDNSGIYISSAAFVNPSVTDHSGTEDYDIFKMLSWLDVFLSIVNSLDLSNAKLSFGGQSAQFDRGTVADVYGEDLLRIIVEEFIVNAATIGCCVFVELPKEGGCLIEALHCTSPYHLMTGSNKFVWINPVRAWGASTQDFICHGIYLLASRDATDVVFGPLLQLHRIYTIRHHTALRGEASIDAHIVELRRLLRTERLLLHMGSDSILYQGHTVYCFTSMDPSATLGSSNSSTTLLDYDYWGSSLACVHRIMEMALFGNKIAHHTLHHHSHSINACVDTFIDYVSLGLCIVHVNSIERMAFPTHVRNYAYAVYFYTLDCDSIMIGDTTPMESLHPQGMLIVGCLSPRILAQHRALTDIAWGDVTKESHHSFHPFIAWGDITPRVYCLHTNTSCFDSTRIIGIAISWGVVLRNNSALDIFTPSAIFAYRGCGYYYKDLSAVFRSFDGYTAFVWWILKVGVLQVDGYSLTVTPMPYSFAACHSCQADIFYQDYSSSRFIMQHHRLSNPDQLRSHFFRVWEVIFVPSETLWGATYTPSALADILIVELSDTIPSLGVKPVAMIIAGRISKHFADYTSLVSQVDGYGATVIIFVPPMLYSFAMYNLRQADTNMIVRTTGQSSSQAFVRVSSCNTVKSSVVCVHHHRDYMGIINHSTFRCTSLDETFRFSCTTANRWGESCDDLITRHYAYANNRKCWPVENDIIENRVCITPSHTTTYGETDVYGPFARIWYNCNFDSMSDGYDTTNSVLGTCIHEITSPEMLQCLNYANYADAHNRGDCTNSIATSQVVNLGRTCSEFHRDKEDYGNGTAFCNYFWIYFETICNGTEYHRTSNYTIADTSPDYVLSHYVRLGGLNGEPIHSKSPYYTRLPIVDDSTQQHLRTFSRWSSVPDYILEKIDSCRSSLNFNTVGIESMSLDRIARLLYTLITNAFIAVLNYGERIILAGIYWMQYELLPLVRFSLQRPYHCADLLVTTVGECYISADFWRRVFYETSQLGVSGSRVSSHLSQHLHERLWIDARDWIWSPCYIPFLS